MEWILILTILSNDYKAGGVSVTTERLQAKEACLAVANTFLNDMPYIAKGNLKYLYVSRRAKCVKVELPKE